MAKEYSGELKQEKFTGELKHEKKSASMITIEFRENRKFDLHIGRNMVTFFGRESKQIPSDWLNHIDWQNVKKYFAVKGV